MSYQSKYRGEQVDYILDNALLNGALDDFIKTEDVDTKIEEVVTSVDSKLEQTIDLINQDTDQKITQTIISVDEKIEQVIIQTDQKIQESVNSAEVKIAESTEANKNFIDTETSDDGVSAIAVRKIDANKAVTTEVIPVIGGPLADLVKGTIGSEVPIGTDIQSFLTSLLCSIKWPTNISTSNASLSSSVGAPTITMSTTTVEVGTNVQYSVKNGASSYTTTPARASGFTYGYSAQNDNSRDSSSTSVSATFGAVTINGDNSTTLTVTSTGNTKQTATGTASAGSATLSGSITAIQGSNTCSATNTSVSYKGSCSELPSYYGCSNTGKTSESYKSAIISAKDNIVSSATSSSSNKSFTGAYKYYIGYSSAVPTTDNELKQIASLIGPGWLTVNGTTTLSTGGTLPAGKTMIIAVPSQYRLNSILNGFSLESKDSFNSTTIQYVLPNDTKINYTVYAMSSAAEWKFKTIIIK